MKDAVHAGRMAIFKHPMNFKELCLPPCVGDGAYTEEEQAWWNPELLRRQLGCRRPSVARNPRKFSASDDPASSRSRRRLRRLPPPQRPVPPPPARGLARTQRRQRPEDATAAAAQAASVDVGVHGLRENEMKPQRPSSTPNRRMRPWRLPNPKIGRGRRPKAGTFILANF